MILSEESRLTLKQFGYSLKQVDELSNQFSNPEYKNVSEVSFIRAACHLKEKKRNFTLGWKPANKTVKKLKEDGYLPKLVDHYSSVFLMMLCENNISPINLDAYFSSWFKKLFPDPAKKVLVTEWEPGRQVRVWLISFSALTQFKFNYLKETYIDITKMKGRDTLHINHDLEFISFVERMNR